ncbi:multidrug effflux MFS transporter [Nevskia soli]|uniref:multidrug effflux MFS transporter n=1 Tax=Nevskia soli TaxID=418856 RepID=UPI00068E25F9|nr:multidrug effflux MFS transporter [Nevskia soli]
MTTAVAQPTAHFLRNALVLGLLTALGPFAIDMYLPSLPVIGASLGVDADMALRSLTAYFLTFALGQMVFGPLSDLMGRKPPLYAGIALFLVASIGCALARDIHTLIILRAIEGVGGATGMVIARAIVRDLHSGNEEVRLLSLLMLVFSVSPVLAPLAGSLIIEFSSWRGVFWLITLLAAMGLLLTFFLVPETRPRAARAGSSHWSVLMACKRLVSDGSFMSLSFIGALAVSGFFVFLANSSFVFTGHYGLTPRLYSLVFGVNAAAFFAGMQLSGRLAQRYGLRRVVRLALAAYAAVLVLLTGLVAAGIDQLALVVGLLFLAYSFIGLMLPGASVLAMAEHGDIAGTASSLMNTLQLVTGTLIMGISGHFATGAPLPMVAGIAACAVLAMLLAQVTLRGNAGHEPEVPGGAPHGL